MKMDRREALRRPRERLEAALTAASHAWWKDACTAAAAADIAKLERAWPALVRRCGKKPLYSPESEGRFEEAPGFKLDLAAFRAADVAALLLVDEARAAGADPWFLRQLFDHGDLDERVSAMRSLPAVGDHPVAYHLLGEAQRANVTDIYEAAWCDHDVASRLLPDDDFNRMVLKMAFADLPLWRVLGAFDRANETLSTMLQDFAVEREAAGRPIWVDTLHLIARAPVDGTRARLLGHLEHGKEQLRLAAAQAIGHLGEPSLVAFVRQRLPREKHPEVRAALELAIENLQGA